MAEKPAAGPPGSCGTLLEGSRAGLALEISVSMAL